MTVLGRSLLVGALAWFLGIGALHVFPSGMIRIDSVGDWIAMLLFKPAEVFLSLFLFVMASVLLISLMQFHLYQYVYLRSLEVEHVWMHVSMFLFALFVFVIQFIKMPLPTVIFIGVVVVYGAANKRLLFLGKRKY
ncbi:MAG: hypothetical protein K0R47_3231 [Brevibacillus sp.]|jgi:hypothetical protein|nr:hypothetical protein [Brevibacillus sp.]